MVTPNPLDDLQVILIFGLSLAGYLLLTLILCALVWSPRVTSPLLARLQRLVPAMAWLALAVIVAHVWLIWNVRFGWRFEVSVRNGPVGFVLFHGALVALVAALPALALRPRAAAPEEPLRWPVLALFLAWLAVAGGASGAPLRYPFLDGLIVPVLGLTALGLASLLAWSLARWRSRSSR